MKTTMLAFLLLYSLLTKATTYYFSSLSGDNSRTNLQAQNPSTPWQTLSKFTATTFTAGDTISFKRGDTFYGSLNVPYPKLQSGSAVKPIVINAYGTGLKPVITGFTTVSAWTYLGNNIWESTSPVSTLSTCNVVSINGVNTAMGRFPNSGWLNMDATTSTSITSSSLNAVHNNWTGADIVIKKEHWITDRISVTSASGSTINFASGAYNPHVNWGFFIQNDARTLDTQNEWYYDIMTKKIRIYKIS